MAGVITYYNKLAADLWERSPEIGDTDEKFCGSHMLYRVDGSFMPHDQCPMADVLAGKVSGIYDAEVHIERPDRSRVIVIVNIAPLVDDSGAIVGAVNSFCENPLRKRSRYTRSNIGLSSRQLATALVGRNLAFAPHARSTYI